MNITDIMQYFPNMADTNFLEKFVDNTIFAIVIYVAKRILFSNIKVQVKIEEMYLKIKLKIKLKLKPEKVLLTFATFISLYAFNMYHSTQTEEIKKSNNKELKILQQQPRQCDNNIYGIYCYEVLGYSLPNTVKRELATLLTSYSQLLKAGKICKIKIVAYADNAFLLGNSQKRFDGEAINNFKYKLGSNASTLSIKENEIIGSKERFGALRAYYAYLEVIKKIPSIYLEVEVILVESGRTLYLHALKCNN